MLKAPAERMTSLVAFTWPGVPELEEVWRGSALYKLWPSVKSTPTALGLPVVASFTNLTFVTKALSRMSSLYFFEPSVFTALVVVRRKSRGLLRTPPETAMGIR